MIKIDWTLIIIVAVVAVAIIVYTIRRNIKDRKELEEKLNRPDRSYLVEEQEDNEISDEN